MAMIMSSRNAMLLYNLGDKLLSTRVNSQKHSQLNYTLK